jgi:hypothetical protein
LTCQQYGNSDSRDTQDVDQPEQTNPLSDNTADETDSYKNHDSDFCFRISCYSVDLPFANSNTVKKVKRSGFTFNIPFT